MNQRLKEEEERKKREIEERLKKEEEERKKELEAKLKREEERRRLELRIEEERRRSSASSETPPRDLSTPRPSQTQVCCSSSLIFSLFFLNRQIPRILSPTWICPTLKMNAINLLKIKPLTLLNHHQLLRSGRRRKRERGMLFDFWLILHLEKKNIAEQSRADRNQHMQK